MTKKIGFVGAGKVGCSFGRYISDKGCDFEIAGYFSLNAASAESAADFAGGRAFHSVSELAEKSDLLLLTVPDGQISTVWADIEKEIQAGAGSGKGLFVGHCSGSQSAEIFSPASPFFSFGSMHPVTSIPDRFNSSERFSGASFTIEGDPGFTAFAAELLSALGNPFGKIDSSVKTLYHAACVYVSNLVCSLTWTGEKLFKDCGLNAEFAENAWRRLFLVNAENIANLGSVSALTGPVERCDTATVEKHLEALSDDTKKVYILLSRVLTETARLKNPGRDYSELINLLDEHE